MLSRVCCCALKPAACRWWFNTATFRHNENTTKQHKTNTNMNRIVLLLAAAGVVAGAHTPKLREHTCAASNIHSWR